MEYLANRTYTLDELLAYSVAHGYNVEANSLRRYHSPIRVPVTRGASNKDRSVAVPVRVVGDVRTRSERFFGPFFRAIRQTALASQTDLPRTRANRCHERTA